MNALRTENLKSTMRSASRLLHFSHDLAAIFLTLKTEEKVTNRLWVKLIFIHLNSL
jgi:hypothetical protein